jgi:NADH-quinone oxidoreductase subunit L
MLGVWILFSKANSFAFKEVFHAVEVGQISGPLLTVAALALFMGAVGKSAQFPLHVWLPDAMAGPTPVSALIHAATMVAAGVFLVARTYPVFYAAEGALTVVAYVGGFTALFAATIATVDEDIKGVLAYSTISQLGYMIMALGVGAFTAGVFHLMTHAFFKALLFLGSGSVIHAVHTQNMHEMGGLWSKMKVTAVTFIVGALALAGIPPFAGFFSKDAILAGAYGSHPLLFWMGWVAAILTAFYMTRQIILVFFGKPHDEETHEHAHESPSMMTVPLIMLAIPATVFGWLVSQNGFINEWVAFAGHGHHHGHAAIVPYLALGGALFGILMGYLIYGSKTLSRAAIVRALKPVHTVLKNKYYVDEFYQATIIRFGLVLAAAARLFDRYVVDGIVNLVGYLGRQFGRLSALFDLAFIDEAVNGVADLTVAGGRAARNLVSGYVQLYVMTLFATVVLGLIIYVIF